MAFAEEVENWTNNIAPSHVAKVVRKALFEITERAIMRSPVGNPEHWLNPDSAPAGYVGGHFRRNWQYSFGTSPAGEIDGVDASGAATINAIQTEAALESGFWGVHYIGNTAPYAQRIEDGWSTQLAPLGIVNQIELELPDIARRAMA